jgi:hypothetical protein
MPGQWQQGQAQGGGREPGGGDGVEHPPPGVTERGQEQRRAAEQQGGDVGVQVVERVQDHFAGGGRDRDDAADEGEVPVWQHRPDHLDGDLGGAQRVPDRVSGECEVHPPQRAGQSGGHGDRGEPGRGRGLPPGHHTGLGHRLAERDNQEQPEPFGQVGRLVRDPAHGPRRARNGTTRSTPAANAHNAIRASPSASPPRVSSGPVTNAPAVKGWKPTPR